MQTLNEVIVFALLERESPGDWARYRSLFQALSYWYPLVVVNRKSRGRVRGKIVVFLKRHEAVWESMFKLLGWRITNTIEVTVAKLRKVLDELRRLQELDLEGVEWLTKYVKPKILLGDLPVDELLEFLSFAEKRYAEYTVAPRALSDPKVAKTSFLRNLRSSKLLALVITVGTRSSYIAVKEFLYELLRMGVVPIDYSYSSIIVAKRVVRWRGVEKFWGSVVDPEEVLRRLEARPYYVVVECRGVDFEKRDVGWGLRHVA